MWHVVLNTLNFQAFMTDAPPSSSDANAIQQEPSTSSEVTVRPAQLPHVENGQQPFSVCNGTIKTGTA